MQRLHLGTEWVGTAVRGWGWRSFPASRVLCSALQLML